MKDEKEKINARGREITLEANLKQVISAGKRDFCKPKMWRTIDIIEYCKIPLVSFSFPQSSRFVPGIFLQSLGHQVLAAVICAAAASGRQVGNRYDMLM